MFCCPYYFIFCLHAGEGTGNFCNLSYPNPVACPHLRPSFEPGYKVLETTANE